MPCQAYTLMCSWQAVLGGLQAPMRDRMQAEVIHACMPGIHTNAGGSQGQQVVMRDLPTTGQKVSYASLPSLQVCTHQGPAGTKRYACWLGVATKPPTQVCICQAATRSLWQANVAQQLFEGGRFSVAVEGPCNAQHIDMVQGPVMLSIADSHMPARSFMADCKVCVNSDLQAAPQLVRWLSGGAQAAVAPVCASTAASKVLVLIQSQAWPPAPGKLQHGLMYCVCFTNVVGEGASCQNSACRGSPLAWEQVVSSTMHSHFAASTTSTCEGVPVTGRARHSELISPECEFIFQFIDVIELAFTLHSWTIIGNQCHQLVMCSMIHDLLQHHCCSSCSLSLPMCCLKDTKGCSETGQHAQPQSDLLMWAAPRQCSTEKRQHSPTPVKRGPPV